MTPSSSGDTPASPGRSGLPSALLAAVVVASVEALAVLAYTVGIGVSGAAEPGLGGCRARAPRHLPDLRPGDRRLRRGPSRSVAARARTPFGVVQLFGLVMGWTLTQGDGDLTHRAGYAVLAVSVLGIALVISPSVGEALDR